MLYWLLDPLFVAFVAGVTGFGLNAMMTRPTIRDKNWEIYKSKLTNVSLLVENKALVEELRLADVDRQVDWKHPRLSEWHIAAHESQDGVVSPQWTSGQF